MSEKPEKVRRQGKGSPKTALLLRLHNINYDALYRLAKERGTSMARVVNDWLQELRSTRV